MMLESLTFLSPWLLGAVAAIPVLWWLLRVMPPRPRTMRFPAFFLLKDLATTLRTAAHTPWWLLLLRSAAVLLFILAFAGPVLHPSEDLPGNKKSAVLIIADNGWASAAHWHARQVKMKEFLSQLRRNNRPVIFLATAPAAEDGIVHSYGPMDAAQAEEWLNRLKPQPWPDARGDAAALAKKIIQEQGVTYTLYFTDGATEAGRSAETEAEELLKIPDVLVADEMTNNPYILRPTEKKGYVLERLTSAAQDIPLQLLAYTEEGAVADELKITFPAGKKELSLSWDMLQEVRNKTVKIGLREPEMASAVFLANAQWRQHPVGIIADSAQKESRDFLSEVYYLRRALEANSDITVDPLETLLKGSFSALILPDSTPLAETEKETLSGWVQSGGFLIRFAGPSLAAGFADRLLPVPLRAGQRAMEGSMTWEKPVRLGAIPEESPLYGLPVPEDITVTKQVLADPSPDVFEKTWLQLEDGTPLVTGAKAGKGTIVLIHTSAGPDWSNFCYSGLFVETLQRMVSLSNGISDYKAETTLPPLQLLDGFGRLSAPDGKTAATPLGAEADFFPSPKTPPGLYGSRQDFKAFNLGEYLPKMQPLKNIPAALNVISYQKSEEIDLKPPLLKLALLLLLADTLITLWLRGMLTRAAAALMFALLLLPAPAIAEEPKELVAGLYLAYIETGDQDIDQTSYNGLKGLGEVISARTTAQVKGVVALDPARDPLAFFPIIYWPMSERQGALSATAAQNIQSYLARGGTILFDTRDRQFGSAGENAAALGAGKLRQVTQNIHIPELTEVPKDHILSRSFYLLDEFAGRYTGGKLWVEKEPSPRHDAVTSVIIGANDWAAAWSKDERDRARFLIEPGGETQREMAYRFGVNAVMAALTGNYKADQVHIPYILERIGQ